VCTALAARWFGDSATTVVTLVLVPVWLVFNQIIPKGLFLYSAPPAVVAFADAVRAGLSCTPGGAHALPTRASPGSRRRSLNVSMEEPFSHRRQPQRRIDCPDTAPSIGDEPGEFPMRM
jgi:hypothetical protein